MKVYEETRRDLRVIAALTGEHMVDVLARLCEGERRRIEAGEATERPTEHRPNVTPVIPRPDAEPE